MRALLRISLRYLMHHRLQSLLMVLSVALGVAVIVAIDLANQGARRAFQETADSMTGKATHQIVGGSGGVSEDLYRRLRLQLGLQTCAPLVEGFVTVRDATTAVDSVIHRPTEMYARQALHVLGVDPFAEGPFRSYVVERDNRVPLQELTGFLTEPDSILVTAETARGLGVPVGGYVPVELGARLRKLRLVGLLSTSDPVSARAMTGLAVCDISTAQELFGMQGRLSCIDLIMTDEQEPRIRAMLGVADRIEKPQTRTGTVEQLTRSFELNLSAVSLLTLIVGIFLVYNTVTFFVVQRRSLIGTLRSVGVTRAQVFGMVMGETLLLGLLGTALGLVLGVLLGQGAVRLVTRTINDLYFVLMVTDTSPQPLTLLKGTAAGLLAAALAAVAPAWEAAAVPATTVLRRSTLESRAHGLVGWLFGGGALLLLLGGALLALPGRRLDAAFSGVALLFLGAALLVPLATVLLMRAVTPLLGLLAGSCGRLAPRSIVRSLSRTAVAVAALMVAVSIIVGLQIMIGSFRQTLVDWLGDTLSADVFVRSTSSTSSISDAFEPQVAEEVAGLPGVHKIRVARGVRIETPRYGLLFLLAASGDVAAHRRFVWSNGDKKDVWRQVADGAVMISEPFEYRCQPGREIELPTDFGPRRFPVAGIFYDYGTERGAVIMADSTYRRCWKDGAITSVAAYLDGGVDAEEVVRRLQTRFADEHRSLQVQSNRTLRQAALEIFERTFTITSALRILLAVVAFIGLLSTLMALQLERRGEVGTLRALGMSVRQVWGTVLLETALLGLAAGLFSLPMGSALAWSLVYVINPRSFGWTIPFIPHASYYLQAIAISLAAGLLAGIYPAYRFSRLRVAETLRVE